jgi:hypothetical protein
VVNAVGRVFIRLLARPSDEHVADLVRLFDLSRASVRVPSAPRQTSRITVLMAVLLSILVASGAHIRSLDETQRTNSIDGGHAAAASSNAKDEHQTGPATVQKT